MLSKLNKGSTAIFHRLIEGLSRMGDTKYIANGDAYMAVHVEVIGTPDLYGFGKGFGGCGDSLIVSVAHYYTQCGDLMKDPDVEFLVGRSEQGRPVFPMRYEQDGIDPRIGYRQGAEFADGQIKFNARVQRDITQFCNQWMRNIQMQQLDPEPPVKLIARDEEEVSIYWTDTEERARTKARDCYELEAV